MAHPFPAEIQWGCVRDVISLVRRGDLTTGDKLDIGQHVAWFWGSALEWYRNADDEVKDGSFLNRLLAVFTSLRFGDDLSAKSTAELCDECENALPTESGYYGAIPIIQILSIVIPILIELLKRTRDEDAE